MYLHLTLLHIDILYTYTKIISYERFNDLTDKGSTILLIIALSPYLVAKLFMENYIKNNYLQKFV